MWKFATKGNYTVKSGYRVLSPLTDSQRMSDPRHKLAFYLEFTDPDESKEPGMEGVQKLATNK